MGFSQKIKEIRSKPESVRMRYVWFLTFLSTIVLLGVWVWSFSLQRRELKMPSLSGIVEPDAFREDKEKMQDLSEDLSKSLNAVSKESQISENTEMPPSSAENNQNLSEDDMRDSRNDSTVSPEQSSIQEKAE
jgi:hypothetical protein